MCVCVCLRPTKPKVDAKKQRGQGSCVSDVLVSGTTPEDSPVRVLIAQQLL